MSVPTGGGGSRLSALLSPGFLTALAVLLANDLVLKSAVGGWVTGKLSDFAGLFVVVVLGVALWPARGGVVVAATVAGFALWKSPASQPLIDGWNAVAPFAMARVVDWTDLAAVAITPVAWRYAVAAPPLAPAVLRYPVLALALLAILGTSTVDRRAYLYRLSTYNFEDGAVVFSTAGPRERALDALGNSGLVLRMTSAGDVHGLGPRWPCRSEGAQGRFEGAGVALRTAGDRALLHVHSVSVCMLASEAFGPSDAVALFQKEVLDPVGGWQRR